jgi:hypothetical protein
MLYMTLKQFEVSNKKEKGEKVLTVAGSASKILEIRWQHSGVIRMESGIEYWTLITLCT